MNEVYRCNACGERIVTATVSPGRAPVSVGCQVTAGCTGRMVSTFHPAGAPLPGPVEWEWYAPTREHREWLPTKVLRDVDHGGLLLRRSRGERFPSGLREHVEQLADVADAVLAGSAPGEWTADLVEMRAALATFLGRWGER